MKKNYGPREERVYLLAGHDCVFIPKDQKWGDEISLSNISKGGMGLYKGRFKEIPPLGEALVGSVQINKHKLKVELECVHQVGPLIGTKIIGDVDSYCRLIDEIFDEELLAHSMRVGKARIPGTRLWENDSGDCLVIHFESNEIKKFDLVRGSLHLFSDENEIRIERDGKACELVYEDLVRLRRFLLNLPRLESELILKLSYRVKSEMKKYSY